MPNQIVTIHRNRVEELTRLASDCLVMRDDDADDDDDGMSTCKIKTLYGRRASFLATSLIHRGLFLENQAFIYDLIRDSWRVYAYIHDNLLRDTIQCKDDDTTSLFNECLIKLTKSQPMNSYLRLSFRQVMGFILRRSSNACQVDVPYLLSFMNELRASFNTLCHEDRQSIRPPSKLAFNESFAQGIYEDAPFLANWSAIEAAKYCISHKFAPEMSANDFLNLLRKEILAPVSFGDKISRRFLVNFLQNIDKFIQDRISESSNGKHTFSESNNIEQFFKFNCSIFQSWYMRNRQYIARLSLIVDDPAECWRNTNLKLCLDLATKFHGFNSPNRDPSFIQTLMSLNTKNWYSNLSLITLSAKQLNELSVLFGIRALASLRGLICEYPPLAAIISNLEGSYEQTYNTMRESKDLDEQCLIEFLDACIELDLLEANRNAIDGLKSDKTKMLYLKYLESKLACYDNGNSQIAPQSRLEEVTSWLNTWSDSSCNSNSASTPVEAPQLSDGVIEVQQPIKSCIDLIVPTCLNIIARAPHEERPELVERVERLISQDYIAQCLFPPNYINKNIKVYHILIDLMKKTTKPNLILDENLVRLNYNDLSWNHTLYRHLCDLHLIDALRINQPEVVDSIQYRAAKFHRKHNNNLRASTIAKDLLENASSKDVKILTSISLIKPEQDHQINHSLYEKIATDIKSCSDLVETKKHNLISKVLRNILRQPSERDKNEQHLFNIVFLNSSQADESISAEQELPQHEPQDMITRWKDFLNSSSLISKTRTLLLFSNCFNERLQKFPDDDQLLNSTFGLDLELLELLGQSDVLKHKASGLECALRILKLIASSNSRLSDDKLERFSSTSFLNSTTKVWLLAKFNLISVITCKDGLGANWRDALINIVKFISQQYPNLFIYSIIVNRLDLQNELDCLKGGNECTQESPMLTFGDSFDPVNGEQNQSLKLIDCQRKLTFWNQLFDHIKSSTQFSNKWNLIVTETEGFLKEIRKISFLCGEYFRVLTIRIPKRLYGFLDYLSKSCDSQTGKIISNQRLEDCEKRLKTVCEQALESIRLLLSYSKRIGESHLTKYEIWFCETFSKQLHELEYRLNLLSKKRPLVQSELEKLVKSVTELLGVCRNTLLEYNHTNRQKLYMELISPMLSRLEPSLIPMPDCCSPSMSNNNSAKPLITIHKISQTVNLIASKTSPKKLKFTGSDGISRCFLLKAHEDLRLDQLIMDLFTSINNLFLGCKETQNKYRLRTYSVTPVSSRSGLIQWIDAPSLCSPYRAWLSGSNGKKLVEELYESTCSVLCDDQPNLSSRSATHTRCQPNQGAQAVDLFYQLLWAKTKPSKKPITLTKPFFGNIIKYRVEFDSSYFQSIVEQLIDRVPNDLVANQFWYKSTNSHSYWLKIREFTNSCAAISIVGYVIGLGDRHPENILLDYNTGEVIHIDYNVCFEFGKSLTVPETVPFRLTQNMIHAFGFAGLEGGFTLSCRNVLNLLKQSKSTLLHLLDPINLDFMIQQHQAGSKSLDRVEADIQTKIMYERSNTNASNSPARFPSVASKITAAKQLEVMDMCSQELSLELNPNNGDVSDLLILNHSSPADAVAKSNGNQLMKSTSNNGIRDTSLRRQQQQQQHKLNSTSGDENPTVKKGSYSTNEPAHFSLDLQHNIKTPVKILATSAISIHQRIRDKLSGADEFVRHYKYKQDCNQKQVNQLLDANSCEAGSTAQTIDLILLNDAQTTEDQVDALIIEATSIKNKAAIFEGWVPWV